MGILVYLEFNYQLKYLRNTLIVNFSVIYHIKNVKKRNICIFIIVQLFIFIRICRIVYLFKLQLLCVIIKLSNNYSIIRKNSIFAIILGVSKQLFGVLILFAMSNEHYINFRFGSFIYIRTEFRTISQFISIFGCNFAFSRHSQHRSKRLVISQLFSGLICYILRFFSVAILIISPFTTFFGANLQYSPLFSVQIRNISSFTTIFGANSKHLTIHRYFQLRLQSLIVHNYSQFGQFRISRIGFVDTPFHHNSFLDERFVVHFSDFDFLAIIEI